MRTWDYLFGLLATVGFALSLIVQFRLLSSTIAIDPFDALFVTVAALTIISAGYMTLRADRRHGLVDPSDESASFVEIAYSLPTWAYIISVVLAFELLLLAGPIDIIPWAVVHLPKDLAFLRDSISANLLLLSLTSACSTLSYIVAAFLLIRNPIPELK